jgi:hypothetical protein
MFSLDGADLTHGLRLRAAALLVLRQRSEGPEQSVYQQFKSTYRYNFKGFMEDCIEWRDEEVGPAPYQLLFAEKFVERRRAALRGPHGLGKTAMASWCVLWFALTRDGDDWKIPTTASAWRQLTKFLWPEIRKWSRRLRWDVIGREPFGDRELSQMSLKLSTGEAFALASDNAALIEGAHASNILYIFDESKAIPDDTFDAAEGALSTGEAYILAISTPGEPQGRFYDIHRRKAGLEDWYVLHVTREMVVQAGRMDPHWAEQRRRQWGERSAVYQNRVEGEFASSDTDGVISLADIERAIQRWHERNDANDWGELTGVGVDVGRGGDPTVLAKEYGHRSIKELERTNTRDTMEVAGMVLVLLRRNRFVKAVVDILGLGAGPYDRLREEDAIRSRVMPFVASARTDLLDQTGEMGFLNKRAAAWWNLREMLQRDEYDLPPDDKLIGDLTAPKWRLMSGGKIQVEEKDALRKRLKRSTDDGDAVVQIAMKRNLSASGDDLEGLGHVDDFQSRWT